jgi:hypothetical protein
MHKLIIALALLAAFATSAAAQPKPRPARRAVPAVEAAPPKKVRTFDFTGDNIDGSRILPDGTTIFGLKAARHGSLIKLRGDFVREIVKTAERL